MEDDAIVYVIDDDTDVREAYAALFRSVEVPVTNCATAREFLDRYDPARPSCLVLDLRLPGMSGLELQGVLNRRRLPPPIVFVSGYGDVAIAVQAVREGALDFLQKPVRQQELLDRVFEGLSRDVETRRRFGELLELERRVGHLTPRERQVMGLVVEGLSNRGIADELHVTAKAVEAYRARVMRKMEARSLAALVRMCVALELWREVPCAPYIGRPRTAHADREPPECAPLEARAVEQYAAGDAPQPPPAPRSMHADFRNVASEPVGRADPAGRSVPDASTTR